MKKKDLVEQNRKNMYRQALRTREGLNKSGDYIEIGAAIVGEVSKKMKNP